MFPRFLKRTFLAGAMLAIAGFATLGTASTAEARGCGGYYGGGYGGFYGAGYGRGFYRPAPVVVARPVVGYGRGFGGVGPYHRGFYGAGYRGFGGNGVSVSFGF